jgi:hypothetical protein
MLQWVRNTALVKGTRSACGILVKKHDGKRALGKVRRREDSVGMDHRETVYDDGMWTDLACDHVQRGKIYY